MLYNHLVISAQAAMNNEDSRGDIPGPPIIIILGILGGSVWGDIPGAVSIEQCIKTGGGRWRR